jgi:AcrR family transcriptional regulator
VNTTARPYRQTARAAASEATRSRIVESAFQLFFERWYDDVTLRDIASGAGVALQTVVNHFGTKDGVMEAVLEVYSARVQEVRFAAEPDDVHAAIAALVGNYEFMGEANIRALALEHRIPALAAALDEGRRMHRVWVERTFPALLAGRRGAARNRRIAQIAVATDVETWKLLRRDHGLSRKQTEAAMKELIQGLEP